MRYTAGWIGGDGRGNRGDSWGPIGRMHRDLVTQNVVQCMQAHVCHMTSGTTDRVSMVLPFKEGPASSLSYHTLC